MTGRTLLRMGVTALVALLLAVVPAVAAAPLSRAAAPGAPGAWDITEQDGGWRVELRLAASLPVRAAQPTLIATSPDPGGAGPRTTDLGLAVPTDGDPTLVSTVTDDPLAGSGTITAVTLGWDGESTTEAGDGGPTTLPAPPPGPVLTADPVQDGGHPVGTAFYNLGDEVVDLAGIPGRRGELRGVIHYPADVATPAPVVLFLHGRHVACADGQMQWPCSGSGDVPSYLGYQEMGQLLASQGFVVVSVSANAINALDGELLDTGDEARAQLVLQTLDRLAAAGQDGSPGFPGLLAGRLDLGRVGLLGHSRGGEAVVRAAQLNAQRARPYGIDAVFPLAPTDVARLTLPGIPLATLLPYCDGDVADLSGQAYVDDSRHAFGDSESVLRASLLMLGANHNFFNTVWSPGGFPTGTADDWSYLDQDQSNPVCGQSAPGRLGQDDQRKAGAGYVSAFFRLTLTGETAFLPMFDGSAPQVPSLAPADVRVLSQAPAPDRRDIARFDTTPAGPVHTGGGLTATVCAGSQLAQRDPLPVCTWDKGMQAPHWSSRGFTPTDAATPMLHVQWDDTGTLTVPVPDRASELSDFDALSIWLGAGDDVPTAADIGIEVIGEGGTVAVSDARVLPAAAALPGEFPLGKLLLRQIHVPVTELAGVGALQAIRITARSGPGSIYLSDLSVVRSAAGSSAATPLPALRPVPTSLRLDRLQNGQGQVAVLLDRPGTEPVTGRWAITSPGSTDIDADRPVTIPAGSRCLVLPLPAPDDPTAPPTAGGADPTGLDRTVVLAALAGARPVALTAAVRVQNAPMDGLDVGVQGDPCREALAAPGAAVVSPASAPAGGIVTVTGTGFRSGESVLFALGTQAGAARAVAGADGAVSATLTVPGDAALGALAVTLTGVGSGRVGSGGLQVVAGPAPTVTATSTVVITETTVITSSTTPSPDPDPGPDSSGDPFPEDPSIFDPGTVPPITMAPIAVAPVTFAQWTVPAAGPNGDAAAPLYSAPTTSPGGTLAQTGFRVAAVVAPAVLLLTGGAALVLIGRRCGAHGSATHGSGTNGSGRRR